MGRNNTLNFCQSETSHQQLCLFCKKYGVRKLSQNNNRGAFSKKTYPCYILEERGKGINKYEASKTSHSAEKS